MLIAVSVVGLELSSICCATLSVTRERVGDESELGWSFYGLGLRLMNSAIAIIDLVLLIRVAWVMFGSISVVDGWLLYSTTTAS